MNVLELLRPYLGIVIGWGLGLAGQSLATGRQRNGAVGRALADLLDIRHQLLGMQILEDFIRQRIQAPPDAVLQLRRYADSIFPSVSGLSVRYNSAVDVIAETNPVLAYELRSKDMIQSYLQKLRDYADADVTAVHVLVDIETDLRPALLDALADSALALAKAHSLRTRFMISRLLRE